MQVFCEEGQLIEDLSSDPLIPNQMCELSYLVEGGKIVASAWRILSGKWDLELEAFDGSKWSLL